jgi:hypothetical protein
MRKGRRLRLVGYVGWWVGLDLDGKDGCLWWDVVAWGLGLVDK